MLSHITELKHTSNTPNSQLKLKSFKFYNRVCILLKRSSSVIVDVVKKCARISFLGYQVCRFINLISQLGRLTEKW